MFFLPKEDLLPVLIREQAQLNNRDFGLVSHPDREPERVSFPRLNKAVDRASWFLEEKLPGQKVFAWLGKNDFRYAVWMLAAAKTGRIVVFPSPRNAPDANARLLAKMSATTLLYGPEARDALAPHLDTVKAAVSGVELVPGLGWEEAMDEDTAGSVKEFPYTATFEEAKNKPFVAVHTSGTSGDPKPIYLNTAAFRSKAMSEERAPDGTPTIMADVFSRGEVGEVFSNYPLFHLVALWSVAMTIACPALLVMPHPDVAPTPDNMARMIRPTTTVLSTVPLVLKLLLSTQGGRETLARVKYINVGGSTPERAVGDAIISMNPNMVNSFGSSELGIPALPMVTAADRVPGGLWNAVRFLRTPLQQKFDEVEGAPGVFELVIPDTEEARFIYTVWDIFPDWKGDWRTKDLFRPVPGRPDLWIPAGRTDDWLVLSNAVKYDPVPMQDAIAAGRPDIIRGVLVATGGVESAAGGRDAPCVIVELAPIAGDKMEAAVEAVRAAVEAANAAAPEIGRIPKELVIVAPPHKPLPRTPKGSIKRKAAVELLAPEIEAAYRDNERLLLAA